MKKDWCGVSVFYHFHICLHESVPSSKACAPIAHQLPLKTSSFDSPLWTVRKEKFPMNFFDLLSARRSVRQYTEEPIERNKLQQIVAAGLMTPSSKNLHSTEFLVVEDGASFPKWPAASLALGKCLHKRRRLSLYWGALNPMLGWKTRPLLCSR